MYGQYIEYISLDRYSHITLHRVTSIHLWITVIEILLNVRVYQLNCSLTIWFYLHDSILIVKTWHRPPQLNGLEEQCCLLVTSFRKRKIKTKSHNNSRVSSMYNEFFKNERLSRIHN